MQGGKKSTYLHFLWKNGQGDGLYERSTKAKATKVHNARSKRLGCAFLCPSIDDIKSHGPRHGTT